MNPLGPKHVAPKHGRLPRAMFTPRGHQHMSCWPRWSWRRSHCHWPSPAGSPGAVQSVQPQQGWRWARCPPRMLHHEEMPAPVPPAPAPSLPTGFTVMLEGGTWSDQAQEPSIGSAAEESRYLEAPPPHPHGPWASRQRLLLQQEQSKA